MLRIYYNRIIWISGVILYSLGAQAVLNCSDVFKSPIPGAVNVYLNKKDPLSSELSAYEFNINSLIVRDSGGAKQVYVTDVYSHKDSQGLLLKARQDEKAWSSDLRGLIRLLENYPGLKKYFHMQAYSKDTLLYPSPITINYLLDNMNVRTLRTDVRVLPEYSGFFEARKFVEFWSHKLVPFSMHKEAHFHDIQFHVFPYILLPKKLVKLTSELAQIMLRNPPTHLKPEMSHPYDTFTYIFDTFTARLSMQLTEKKLEQVDQRELANAFKENAHYFLTLAESYKDMAEFNNKDMARINKLISKLEKYHNNVIPLAAKFRDKLAEISKE